MNQKIDNSGETNTPENKESQSNTNLFTSLPMKTSTAQPSSTRRFDGLRSVHDEQKRIEESQMKANFSNSQASAADSEQSSYSKPTYQDETETYNAHYASAGAPSSNGNTSAAANMAGSRKPKSTAAIFAVAFVGAALACILCIAIASFLGVFGGNNTTSNGVTLGSTSSSTITASDTSTSLAEQVSAKCLPSVVSVTVYASGSTATSIYDYLGGGSSSDTLTAVSTGSGVVISQDGYIMTNQHVIEDGTVYYVTVNGEEVEAQLVGADASSDIAVLKVDADNLTAIEIGDSDAIKTGEWVMTIGSPYGLEQSVATGIISNTSRSQVVDSSTSNVSDTKIYPNMIQTDAAINPGNSGGALVDENGQLIGINTLIASSSGSYSGVGFAIPVNYAIGIAKDLIAGKTPTYAALGVACTSITDTIASRYGFATSTGAYVSRVTEGGAAEAAGIEQGDIITEFDGEKIESSSDLTLAVRGKNVGDTVTVKFYRDNSEQSVEVMLGETESTSSSSSDYGYGYGYDNDSSNGNSYGFGLR